ncbi:MAG: hypothetical protein EPO58_16020 [Chitinophagaceae bacterium]|nr:MAG: hypothetical protein EPO58_16020 [Chitinophagaceae bacterium]
MRVYISPFTFNIEVDEDSMTWRIYYADVRIGEFEFREDEKERKWLSGCEIHADYQRKGLGGSVIRKAVKHYGAVYFCTADRIDMNHYYGEYDSRYLTEEGVKLMESCLKKRIIRKSWTINPWD